jgi:hypothetical protein
MPIFISPVHFLLSYAGDTHTHTERKGRGGTIRIPSTPTEFLCGLFVFGFSSGSGDQSRTLPMLGKRSTTRPL